MTPSIAVVGAGAAGLSAALALRERGLDPILLDAADRPGGKLGTDAQRGFLLERAAIGLLDRTGELTQLCKKLGLQPLPASPAASHRYIERAGRVHALGRGPGDLVRSKLLSGREKLQLLAEPFRSRAAPDATVAQFFSHRLGPAGRFLGDALQTGIYAGDPELLEMRSAFPLATALEERHGSLARGLLLGLRGPRPALSSFRGGMQDLVDALARRTALRLRAKLLAVRRDGPRYRLQLDGGEMTADRLVLAIPAPQAAQALEPLDAALAARLRELAAAPVTLVHVALGPEDVAPLHTGFGLLRPGKAVVGALFPAALWPGRAPAGRVLLTALVGGARHPAAGALPEAALADLVQTELRLPRPPELLAVVRWPEAIPQYTVGHAARVGEINRLTSAHPGLALAGAWYRGVGVLDCLRDGRNAAESLAI